jgi:hypothetical protein
MIVTTIKELFMLKKRLVPVFVLVTVLRPVRPEARLRGLPDLLAGGLREL